MDALTYKRKRRHLLEAIAVNRFGKPHRKRLQLALAHIRRSRETYRLIDLRLSRIPYPSSTVVTITARKP